MWAKLIVCWLTVGSKYGVLNIPTFPFSSSSPLSTSNLLNQIIIESLHRVPDKYRFKELRRL